MALFGNLLDLKVYQKLSWVSHVLETKKSFAKKLNLVSWPVMQ